MALHGSLTDVFLSASPVDVIRQSALDPELVRRLVDATLQFAMYIALIVVAAMIVWAIGRARDLARIMIRENRRFEEVRTRDLQSLLEFSHQQQSELANVLQSISKQNAAIYASTDASEGVWSKQSEQILYATFDSLSPTEIALAVFTSPERFPSVERSPLRTGLITATAKEAYLWAGAVACVMENRPETTERQILVALNRALRKAVQWNRSSFSGWSVSPLSIEAQTRLIESFAREAGVDVTFHEIEARTNAAYEMLLWRGLIEDPLWKGVSGAALAVALIVPVQWTSTQNGFSVDALGWHYTQQGEGNSAERSFRLRVKEVSKAVKDEIVPGIIKIIEELSESPDQVPEDTGQGAEKPFRKLDPTRQLQEALRLAGFDPGPVDGIFGPRTQDAMRRFQRTRGLPETGNPDKQSIEILELKRPGPGLQR